MNAAPELAYRQAFAAALIDRAADACPPGLDAVAARRFRVYRNNVHGALIDALGAAYPVTRRLVGDDFFAAMAREFFLGEASRARSLALYGAGFADFIEHFPPTAGLAYLADVARLERAWLEALHAPDLPALDAAALPGDGNRLLTARFEAHPAVRLVGSPHPVVSIWRANREGQAGGEIAALPESALVTRPGFEVATRALDPAVAGFADALLAGASVQDAYQATAGRAGDFDVGAAFSRLLEAGAFARACLEPED